MTVKLLKRKDEHYSDPEVVEGLHGHKRRIEEWFYNSTKKYFNDHFHEVFFDEDRKQEIFQTAFLKLWTEMDNGRIRTVGDQVCRQQQDGQYSPMTCSLTTFLMAFARTEYRELVRSLKECTFPELHETTDTAQQALLPGEDSPEEQKVRIIDECISTMTPRCADILTMFYYQQMTLDQIMELRPENTSKNGLKTAKNKCMNALRERVTEQFRMFNLSY